MAFSADHSSDSLVRCSLLRQLRERLELVHDLSAEVRLALTGGDAAKIDDAAAQMETIAQEFKLLAQEYDRLPPHGADETADGPVERERKALAETAERIARSAAVNGGLLERLLTLSRGLIGLFGAATDGTYQSTGRSSELPASGLRLREQV
jgi:hypothetical protein